MEGPATPRSPRSRSVSRSSSAWRSTLRELIVDGQLPEGTPLVQRDLAQQLGVSPTPVRAGLSQLEREGFVAVTPDRPRRRQPADARGLRGDLRGTARARGAGGEARRPTPSERAEIARDEGDAARSCAGSPRAGRARATSRRAGSSTRRATGRAAAQRLVDEVERLFWRADRYNRLVLSTAERFRESVGRYSGLPRRLRGARRRRRGARSSTRASAGRSSERCSRAPLRGRVRVSRRPRGASRDALAEALGPEARVTDGDSERDLHGSRHQLPPAAAP